MGDKLDAAKKEYEMLIGTRTNMLERPLRKIDELKEQKSIDLNSDMKTGETSMIE